ncbi:hypothetical protein [Klebsiella pneumoniae]|uniref:hypothetical protein n=1 Tax=Klebsiella pneumoniae TaxID=573 RepID=UPI00115EB445|nr:hypothetical protein [Klebsiella pneumoniae]
MGLVTMPEEVVNDCLVELDREITPEIIAKIVQMLPSDITHLAEEWGWNDTEVGDKVYTFIKSH